LLSILGVNFFSGKLHFCTCDRSWRWEPDVVQECAQFLDTVVTKNDCVTPSEAQFEVKWDQHLFHWDHVFAGIHTCFVLSTLSNWDIHMYWCVNNNGVDMQPRDWNHPEAALFFVIAIIVCSMFSVNLIVSVVVDNFDRIRSEQPGGSAFLTETQMIWKRHKRIVNRITLSKTTVPPEAWWRIPCFNLVEHPSFEPFILTCIMLNIVSMACEVWDASDDYQLALDIIDIIFIVIFTIEAFLKISAYHFQVYVNDHWNVFDFVIVWIGWLALIPSIGLGFNSLRIFRVMRIGRAFRLVQGAENLRMFFMTLLYASPSLFNIGLLIFVVFSIFAIIGISLFGDVGCGYLDSGETLEMEKEQCGNNMDKINFSAYPQAMNLLYRVSTGDAWTDIYTYYLNRADHPEVVQAYFIFFFVFGGLMLFNLFVGVVLQEFDENREEEETYDSLHSVHVWRDEWRKYDPEATGRITAEQFVQTVRSAPWPAGVFQDTSPRNTSKTDEFRVAKCLWDMHLLTTQNLKAKPTMLWKLLRWLGRNFVTDEPFREAPDREVIEHDSSKHWMVEYEAAVVAVAMKALYCEGSISFPIFVQPEAHEEYVVNWYCKIHKNREDLLKAIRKPKHNYE